MRKARQMPVPETLYTKVKKNAIEFYSKHYKMIHQPPAVKQTCAVEGADAAHVAARTPRRS